MYLYQWLNVLVLYRFCGEAAATGQVLSLLCIKIIHPWTFCGDTFRIWGIKFHHLNKSCIIYREEKSKTSNRKLLKLWMLFWNCKIKWTYSNLKQLGFLMTSKKSTKMKNLRNSRLWKSQLIKPPSGRAAKGGVDFVRKEWHYGGGREASGKWVKDRGCCCPRGADPAECPAITTH